MKRRIFLMSILVLSCMCLCACSKETNIISEQRDEKLYFLEYSPLNEEKTQDLQLTSKDELQVDITCASGSVKLSIVDKNGTKAYTGIISKDTNFIVGIPKDGIFTIIINGKKADGSIKILVKE